MAAGGIVVRTSERPLFGVVRQTKDNAWVLPKGKLKPGESARVAAKREVEEETGHAVMVLGFLGSMSQVDERKHKIIQFWHMRANGEPVRPLMSDIKAVKWLPLRQAIEKLSRPHEKAFLAQVGPAALQAAAPQKRVSPRNAAAVAEPEIAAQETMLRETAMPEEETIFGTIRAWLRRMGRPAIQG